MCRNAKMIFSSSWRLFICWRFFLEIYHWLNQQKKMRKLKLIFVTSFFQQRPHKATADEMTKFHSDDYIRFLRSIRPDNMSEYNKQMQRCESIFFSLISNSTFMTPLQSFQLMLVKIVRYLMDYMNFVNYLLVVR